MKCLTCPNEIEETDETNLERSKWVHVTLTAQRNGGNEVILSGHVCPKDAEHLGSAALMV